MTVGIQQLMWAIERLNDSFHERLFVTGDLDAALATARPDFELSNSPVDRTPRRGDDLRRYLADDLMPNLPADLEFHRVTRTVDQRRVVQETQVSFTHDRAMPWLLPGIEPTHRRAEVLTVSIASFRHTTRLGDVESRMASHRTLWDYVGLLAQLGLPGAQLEAATAVHT